MNSEQEIKDRILHTAYEKFQQYGFSKVTMEEIAADLGISKKTLYKYFSNKEHVLRELLDNFKCDFELYVENLFKDDSIEFIEKLKNLSEAIILSIDKYTPYFVNIQDLKISKSNLKISQ